MAAAVGNAPTMSGSKPDAVTCWLSGYIVRSVLACHRQAAEIAYLGFVESATTLNLIADWSFSERTPPTDNLSVRYVSCICFF